ncbi:PREDICTED: uncharacterized protein LOC107100386 isoform X1 [Cyprinodon variegatus]|uniref:uncharacterized protein LOC107100386 isoform X1 n=1 Tax=Cyprinodon variegatus TaxID=28743 RepID=UPI0007429B1A|nr:PREDICTED: uncharacterized protein LOC107100386 isoform X1 [Cyprinodon variegatus]XP_015254330.1 PREDICTED: uncharacterized protein LOC107100386 isoform X1 [Cyprinodon variegatus]
MEVCNEWEIHIPMEAEVKNIPLKSLPNSILRRIGLTVSDGDSSRKPTDSSEVIWICPAVIGRKGEGHKGKRLAEFLGTEFQGSPLKMSFVSSNRAAREVLKNVPAGKPLPKKQPLCQDLALQANQDAVVIYNGQIYLCIRKGRKRRQKAEDRSSARTTKELGSSRRKIKPDAGKVMSSLKAIMKKGASTVGAPLRPSPSGHRADANSQCVNASGLDSEQTALQLSYRHENQRNPTSRTSGEHERINLGEEGAWTGDMDGDQTRGQDELKMPESLHAAAASTSRHMDFDFNELEQEERIAQLKAKFMQSEAALNNLLS